MRYIYAHGYLYDGERAIATFAEGFEAREVRTAANELVRRANAYNALVANLKAVTASLGQAEAYHDERTGEHDNLPSPEIQAADALLTELGELPKD